MPVLRSSLKTTPAQGLEDVRQFFDDFAAQNTEQHGPPDQLMRYRVALLKVHANLRPEDVLPDIGCGNGNHLMALNGAFSRGIGVDISSKMIASAQATTHHDAGSHLQFNVDDAHVLMTLPDASIDVAMCIGALEHMPDKQAVVHAVYRVLRPGGRFVCLTPNDQFLWYRWLAPSLGLPTTHLATDRRLDAQTAHALLHVAGFAKAGITFWSFIPRGDMPRIFRYISQSLDYIGKFICSKHLRSGLVLSAQKADAVR